MMIDRDKVKDAFYNYTKSYGQENAKIKLKIDHTYRVAELCEIIARDLCLSENDIDIAWLTGMLHDIGRFEQVKRFDTFNDALSVDHASFGADLLFKEQFIREFVEDDSKDELIENAIRQHSVYRIDSELDDNTQLFCNILRDADKIDILKACTENPFEIIYNTTRVQLEQEVVSEAVMESFFEHHATLRSKNKNVIDHYVSHISLMYELVFSKSIQIVNERGYLEHFMTLETKNPVTKKQLERVETEIRSWMNQKLGELE